MAHLNVVRYVSSTEKVLDANEPDFIGTSAVIVVTGQSSSNSCRLPAAQKFFLERVIGKPPPEPDFAFPWATSYSSERTREPSLAMASMRNMRQFFAAQFNRSFQAGCKRLFEKAFHDPRKKIVFLTGSCGYQISLSALNQIEQPNDVLLVALGPVGFARCTNPRVKVVHVRGRGDLISQLLSVSKPDFVVDCGHMSYWSDTEVLSLCRGVVHEFLGL